MAFQTKIRRARFVGSGYTGAQMAQVAEGLLKKAMLPRIRNGLTVYDTPARPLKPAYAKAKAKKSPPPVRNWVWTGHTLRACKVLTAKPNQAAIGFVGSEPNKRAAINNARERQFGVSPSDRRQIGSEFAALGPSVKAVQI